MLLTSNWYTGRIVTIAKRNWKQYVGIIDSEASSKLTQEGDGSFEWVMFVPNDIRIPRARIKTTQKAQICNKLMTVAFDSWDRTSPEPTG